MVESNVFREEWADDDDRRESGLPGDGKGRREPPVEKLADHPEDLGPTGLQKR